MKEIRNIIAVYDKVDWTTEKAALATVVRVEESSYRRIGARMFVNSNGDWIGGISGGCLEGDALKRAQRAILSETPSTVIYDTMDDDAHQIGVGLGCNGRIEILFTPIDPKDKHNPIERLKRIQERREPTIFYQVITSESPEFNLVGLYGAQETAIDFTKQLGINHSKLIENTNKVLIKKKSQVLLLDSTKGEKIEVLIEFLRPEIRLIIVGDNYDVNAFVGIAHEMGWEINVVGLLRKINKSIHKLSKQILSYNKAESLKIDHYTAVVLMSHDYNLDKKMLQLFLKKEPTYIGMLGPKKRMYKMEKELRVLFPEVALDNVSTFHSPIGLDIGAESPEEIALSVAAEIISVFRNRKGRALKHREGAIHERSEAS